MKRIQLVTIVRRAATRRCSAALIGALLAVALFACRLPLAPEAEIFRAPAPSEAQRYCAWFGDARDGTLYFGMAAFWWAKRQAGGDATAELRIPGPQPVGRFDLRALRFLEPLEVSTTQAHGGVWDVLAHPNGRVYFTTFFDAAGWVDPETGEVRRLPGAGPGLNELALGEEGAILVSRYGGPGPQGSVVVLDPEGSVLAEHRLSPVPGFRVAAKSVAFDPLRREIWVNTDLLPEAPDGEIRHDARILGPDGRERLRFAHPEVQFMAFAPDGTGFFAEREDMRLWLRVRPPERAAEPLAGRRILLDGAFPAALDFAQEIRPAADGSVIVTRWSGRIHRVRPDGRVQHFDFPHPVEGGLYYSAVLDGGRVCATYCGEVSVVCRSVP
jgi:hypothetical protein